MRAWAKWADAAVTKTQCSQDCRMRFVYSLEMFPWRICVVSILNDHALVRLLRTQKAPSKIEFSLEYRNKRTCNANVATDTVETLKASRFACLAETLGHRNERRCSVLIVVLLSQILGH